MKRLSKKQIKRALYCPDCLTVEERGGQIRNICSLSAELISGKRERRRIGFLFFLKRQIRFLGWKIWLAQGLMMMLFYKALEFLGRESFVAGLRYITLLLCCMSVLTFFLAMPFLYRSTRCGMYEMECATRYSSWRLLAARLILTSVGNIILLGGFWLITSLKTPLQAESILLYLLMPYLAVKSGILYLLRHLPVREFAAGSKGLGIACLCLLFLLYHFCPAFFQQTFSVGNGLLCVLLLISVMMQMRVILSGSPCMDAGGL